jgi:hypothetical protein
MVVDANKVESSFQSSSGEAGGGAALTQPANKHASTKKHCDVGILIGPSKYAEIVALTSWAELALRHSNANRGQSAPTFHGNTECSGP